VNIRQTKVLIVGGGPAGLAAAASCRQRGVPYLLVEAGKRLKQRSHQDQANLTSGVGGAGLYSDGKFSFFPSATRLWELHDRSALRESFQWLSSVMAGVGITTPDFPERSPPENLKELGAGIAQKLYQSTYMSLGDRKQLIGVLEQGCGGSILVDSVAERLEYDEQERIFRCALSAPSTRRGGQHGVHAPGVIFAGGRFGPTQWGSLLPEVRQVFRRLEVGVRLEQPAGDFFLRGEVPLDPKFILRSSDERYTWRTFCCCREGEIVLTSAHGLTSVSGRGDCDPSGSSNVGFNLVVTDAALGTDLWHELRTLNARYVDSLPRSQPLNEFLHQTTLAAQPNASVAEVLGARTSAMLAEGIILLQRHFPKLLTAACTVVAPTFEGVGNYADLDGNLKIVPYPLWVAGDATGIFRGLTAALISGYYSRG
jgi:uncharacterized FAD-dependent dehydrogenase